MVNSPRKFIKISQFLIIMGILLATFLVVGSVLAAVFSINTNENPASVQEWFDQGVPIWHTDDVGDVAEPKEDIVNTWVATGNDSRIYFMMELADSPALETMLREAVAYLDCDGDGDNGGLGDIDDVIIGYLPHEDTTFIFRGDQNQGGTLDPEDGQRENQYVEWGVDLRDLPPTNPLLQSTSDCQHAVRIRFLTTDTSVFPGVPIDETTPFDWYNIPTAINLNNLESHQSIGYHFSIFVIIFVLLSSLVLLLYLPYRHRRNSGSR